MRLANAAAGHWNMMRMAVPLEDDNHKHYKETVLNGGAC